MNQYSSFRFCPYDGELLHPGEQNANSVHPKCPKCGFVDYQNPRPCVAALIIQDRKILLSTRKFEPALGEWDIPGGFIEKNESAEEAVVREVSNETTLQVRIAHFLGSIPDVYEDETIPTLNLCFLVDVISGEPQPKSDVASLSWFTLDQLPSKMAFRHQYQVLEWVRCMFGEGSR